LPWQIAIDAFADAKCLSQPSRARLEHQNASISLVLAATFKLEWS
jgi:hypothetical protein